MKKFISLMAMLSIIFFNLNAQPALNNQLDSISYAIGQDVGKNLKRTDLDLNLELIIAGLKTSLEGEGLSLSEADVRSCLQDFQRLAQANSIRKRKELADKNQAEGAAFLSENAEKEGIITLESGIQYKVLVEGEGDKPSATDMVDVHYEGKLLSGEKFDSSYDRGEPTSFQVNQVIKGWTEILQLMNKGAKWEVFIPASLAYGERGTPNGEIPPNAVLNFTVELLDIKK